MNVPRRVDALKREVRYREEELERVAELRAKGEQAVTAFPDFVDKYLAEIRAGIAEREAEILKLESGQILEMRGPKQRSGTNPTRSTMPQKRRFVTNDYNVARLQMFEKEILVACEQCGKCAVINRIETLSTVPTMRIARGQCSHCGRIWQQPYSYWSYQSLPLWLVTDYRGHRLFAYNEQHLMWLESFISAEIRENKIGGSSALHAILPRWMTSSKNRMGVVRGLARLRKKLKSIES